MPDINKEDLLSLHHQIEKAEREQRKLEDLLADKSKALKRNRASKMLLKLLCSVLLMLTLALIAYVVFWTDKGPKKMIEQGEYATFDAEIDTLKIQLSELKDQGSSLKNLEDLYLYRNLIDKDTIYSVQIQSFTKDKISWISEKFTNSLVYSDTSYYKLSLGIFETLAEAQKFRKILLKSGLIDKNVFVISYKEGKRIRIENPF